MGSLGTGMTAEGERKNNTKVPVSGLSSQALQALLLHGIKSYLLVFLLNAADLKPLSERIGYSSFVK